MWLWECELRRLGLRRRSHWYWQCERRYGLPPEAYLSVFCHAQERQSQGGIGVRERVDISAFHITFCLGVDRVHFYFHEVGKGAWEPGGHTSMAELRRYLREPLRLRSVADGIAAKFLAALGMELLLRPE
jgi:hypothetical protein